MNSRIIPVEPVLNAGLRNSRTSSIGSSTRSSHTTNRASTTTAMTNAVTVGALEPAPLGRLDEPEHEGHDPDDRDERADRVEAALLRVLRPRHEEPPGDEGDEDHRHVDEEHRPVPEVAEQPAGDDRAEAAGRPGDAGPDGDGLGALAGREDVDEDRQRGRHDQRRGDTHHGATGDDLPHLGGQRRHRRGDEEQHQPELQRALAAEAVAEGPGREQQPGEHERVRGDDPLQLGLRRVEVARQRRQGDVEAGVADDDDHQAEAQHAERPPALVVQAFDVAQGGCLH